MRKQTLYRYFEKLKYAQQFIDGSLRFQALSYYRNIENAQRADRVEGSLLHRPKDGLVLTRVGDGMQLQAQDTYAPSVRANEVFIACMSKEHSTRLKEKFGPYCVEIKRFGIIKTRLNNELARRFPKAARVLIHNSVTYYDQTDDVRVNWIAERLVMHKLRGFEEESEVRVAFSVTGALDLGSEIHGFLAPGELPERSEPPPPITLEVGDLSSLCRLLP